MQLERISCEVRKLTEVLYKYSGRTSQEIRSSCITTTNPLMLLRETPLSNENRRKHEYTLLEKYGVYLLLKQVGHIVTIAL
jgi:hypothetical protein